jgi:hypothetical protein
MRPWHGTYLPSQGLKLLRQHGIEGVVKMIMHREYDVPFDVLLVRYGAISCAGVAEQYKAYQLGFVEWAVRDLADSKLTQSHFDLVDFVEPSEAAPHNATAYDLVRAIITALYHTFGQFYDEPNQGGTEHDLLRELFYYVFSVTGFLVQDNTPTAWALRLVSCCSEGIVQAEFLGPTLRFIVQAIERHDVHVQTFAYISATALIRSPILHQRDLYKHHDELTAIARHAALPAQSVLPRATGPSSCSQVDMCFKDFCAQLTQLTLSLLPFDKACSISHKPACE